MSRRTVLGAVVVIVLVIAALGFYLFSSPVNGGSTTASTAASTTSESSSSTSTVTTTSVSAGSSTSSSSTSSISETDWTTYHGDNSRSGYVSTSVTDASRSWTSQSLDGAVYAEPLTFEGMVFVATENNSVYALDHGTGAIAWKTHLGDPVPRSQLQCGDIDPTGITGTPVIDPATRTIYVVAFEMPGRHFLVALNTGNGSVNFTIPADPAGADPKVEQQRAALTLGNGRVYVPYGGLYGDCGAYHGWVVGANADGSGSLISYQVPTGREGGIWGPSGAVMDVSGDLFVSTGNSASSSTFDYGNAVIELSPTLQQLAYFAPTNWVDLNSGDTDLGSSGPALLGQGLIFQIGKEGVGYLLNESNLGGIGGQIYSAQVCSAVFGGDAAVGSTVFVPCSDGLVSLRVSPSTFNQAWAGPNFPAGPPVVTGNVVWTVDVSSGNLYGLDATSGSKIFSFSTASVTHFTTPAVGPGFIYVAAGSQLFAFQIG